MAVIDTVLMEKGRMMEKIEFIESYIKVQGGDYQWSDNHGELVRCRDCKNGEPGACGYGVDCDGVWHADDWFCADGERR